MKLCSLSPNLMVENVNDTITYYQDILGFSLRMAVDDTNGVHMSTLPHGKTAIYGQLVRDDVEIMVQQQESLVEDIPALAGHTMAASATFYITVTDIKTLYDELAGKADCVKALETTWYNMQEFYIRDLNGYILGFAEQAK